MCVYVHVRVQDSGLLTAFIDKHGTQPPSVNGLSLYSGPV